MKVKITDFFELIKNMKNKNYTEFEGKFIKNLSKDSNIYVTETLSGMLNTSKIKEFLYLTEKQSEIYTKIDYKYNPILNENDIYHKYTLLFKEKGIELRNLDIKHLENFRGISNESENFKKWVEGIYEQYKID